MWIGTATGSTEISATLRHECHRICPRGRHGRGPLDLRSERPPALRPPSHRHHHLHAIGRARCQLRRTERAADNLLGDVETGRRDVFDGESVSRTRLVSMASLCTETCQVSFFPTPPVCMTV